MDVGVYGADVCVGLVCLVCALVGRGGGRLRRLPRPVRLVLALVGLLAVGTGGRGLHWLAGITLGVAAAGLVTAVVAVASLKAARRRSRG